MMGSNTDKLFLWFGGDKGFKNQIENDKLKNRWCQQNNYKLVTRINYEDDDRVLK